MFTYDVSIFLTSTDLIKDTNFCLCQIIKLY